jgi:hypothetical protein
MDYLNEIESLKKAKEYDKAWGVANKAVVELFAAKDDSWYMMFYQMADILAREKKWFQALLNMGFCIHYLGRIGGSSHEYFIKHLLKKFNSEEKLFLYIELCKKTPPKNLKKELHKLLQINDNHTVTHNSTLKDSAQ